MASGPTSVGGSRGPRLSSNYELNLERAIDHYHRGALGDCRALVAGTAALLPDHDAHARGQLLLIDANTAARLAGVFPDDPCCSTAAGGGASAANAGGTRHGLIGSGSNEADSRPTTAASTHNNSNRPGTAALSSSSRPDDDTFADLMERYTCAAAVIADDFGDRDVRLAAVYLNRGIVCLQCGRVDDAVRFLRGCLEILSRVFSAEHVLAADAHHNLGVCCERSGDAEAAKTHYVQSLKIRARFDDSRRAVDAALIETMTNVAMLAWTHEGDPADCLRQLQRLIPLARRLPKRHDTDLVLATVLTHAGAASLALGSPTQAAALLGQARPLRTSRLGADHALTRLTQSLWEAANAVSTEAREEQHS